MMFDVGDILLDNEGKVFFIDSVDIEYDQTEEDEYLVFELSQILPYVSEEDRYMKIMEYDIGLNFSTHISSVFVEHSIKYDVIIQEAHQEHKEHGEQYPRFVRTLMEIGYENLVTDAINYTEFELVDEGLDILNDLTILHNQFGDDEYKLKKMIVESKIKLLLKQR